MRLLKLAVITAGTLMSLTSQARDQNLLFQFGVDAGGDELVKVTYTNGDTETIDAGGLLQLAVGTTFQTMPESQPQLETQLSIGLKFDFSTAENGDLSWDRYPIEILQFHTTPKWRFGGGLTYHLSPELSGSGFISPVQAKFDNALGVIIEIDHVTSGRNYIGGRITMIDYKLNNASFDGNSIGVNLGVRF